MTFRDLYFTNSDWEKSTILGISTCSANKSEKLKAYKALMTYAGYEVVGFSLNWVVLRAPICFLTTQGGQTMILYPYADKNSHYLSNDLMVIIFQQFLLEVRFDSHRLFTCSGKNYFYLFTTTIHREHGTMYYTLDPKLLRRCEDLDVLISLTDQINNENEY
jgi:hypothetical protein